MLCNFQNWLVFQHFILFFFNILYKSVKTRKMDNVSLSQYSDKIAK